MIDKIVDLLNEAVKADPEAVAALLEQRVPCHNRALGDHPDFTVQSGKDWDMFGALGLVNGICSRLTGEVVCAQYDEDGHLTGFDRLLPVPAR